MPGSWSEPELLDPEGYCALLRFRVERLKHEAKLSLRELSRERDTFAAWNGNVNALLALAMAYGQHSIAQSFFETLRSLRHAENAQQLGHLFSLWSLTLIEQHAGWFLAENCVTPSVAKVLPQLRERLHACIEPHWQGLTDAFGFDNSILRAPIAEPDYVAGYALSADVPV